MPVLYANLDKHDSLSREPYASFLKKYDAIKQDINEKRIELQLGGENGTFENGFYVEGLSFENPKLTLFFDTVLSPETDNKKVVFIRAIYSCEAGDEFDPMIQVQRAKDIKLRVPYYYLPGVTHMDFSSQLDDEYKLIFDALVDDKHSIPEVCCSLIGLIIAIFSLDD